MKTVVFSAMFLAFLGMQMSSSSATPDVPLAVCEAPNFAGVAPDGVEDLAFPTGYWAGSYYEGQAGISGSPYGPTSGDAGAGTAVFRGEAFWGMGENPVTVTSNGSASYNRWSNTETPTSPTPPPGYQGTTWASGGNPYYEISFRRQVDLPGVLSFGYDPATEVTDDTLEVFVNGTRVFAYWPSSSSPDTRPGAGGSGAQFAVNAGDEVQVRFVNLGSIGGLTFHLDTAGHDCSDAPTAGTSYGTASHIEHAASTLYLGTLRDDDTTDIASANADGDGADDDGVSMPTLTQGQSTTIPVSVTQASGGAGYLQGWIDWNGDGAFGAGEQIATNLQSASTGTSTITLPVTVPASATLSQTFARFRWSSTAGLSSTAAASDGEVEDYALTISAPISAASSTGTLNYPNTGSGANPGSIALLDWGGSSSVLTDGIQNGDTVNFDLPGCRVGTLTATFSGVTANGANYRANDMATFGGAASHTAYNGPGTGEALHSNTGANLDVQFTVDWSMTVDGVSVAPDIVLFDAEATNPEFNGGSTENESITGTAASGVWSLIEDIGGNGYSVNGIGTNQFVLDQTYIPANAPVLLNEGATSTTLTIEVGDSGQQAVAFGVLLPCDYGDASGIGIAAHSFNQTATSVASPDGLSPETGQLYLGTTGPDAEQATQGAAGTGDDTDSLGDDEDGVVFPSMTAGGAYTLTVNTVGSGTLTGWIDYNQDGTLDSDETVTGNLGIASTGGIVAVPIHIPASAAGTTFARFRYSTDMAARNPTGTASDGEVEDYQVTIGSRIPNPANPNTPTALVGVCTAYPGTGLDQSITVPAAAQGLKIKLWGAGGGHEVVGSGYSGAGGYTEAQFDSSVITPGDTLTLVVGEGGNRNGRPDETTPAGVYGFGSVSGHDQGGGLTGLFTGSGPVLETDQGRALAIAGGGGGYEHSGGTPGNGTNGGNGNSPTAGGQPTMRGSTDVSPYWNGLISTAHRGGGGGGYSGGGRLAADAPYSSTYGSFQSETAAAAGGSGYVASSAIFGRVLFMPDGTITPPNAGDADYVAGVGTGSNSAAQTAGGDGRAILCWDLKDYSDAPLASTSYGGAVHDLDGKTYLGATITAELADYDNATASADADDGVTIPALVPGQTGTITVTVAGPGFLNAWIDFDGDNTFSSPVEQIALDVQDTDGDGTISVPVTVPAWATNTQTFARFRWSSNFSLGPDGAASDGEVEDYAVTLGANGAQLSGVLFLDNGLGGGTAHNAAVDGTEAGTALASVSLLDGASTLIATTPVAPDGTWAYTLPNTYSGPVTVTVMPQPGLLTISEQTSGLPALGNADPYDGSFTFTPVSGQPYASLDIGLIQTPRLSADRFASAAPGQIVILAHRYEATTSGMVSFALVNPASTPAGAFASAIYTDADCDGMPGQPLTAATTVVVGQTLCLIVRTQVSTGVDPNATHSYDIEATTAYSGIGLAGTLRNTDRIGGGTTNLVLHKLVRNVTKGDGEVTVNQGDIGDVLRYRIMITNPDSAPATQIVVSDATPAYTALASPILSPVTIASGVSCTLATPTSNVAGYVGPLQWICAGSMPPGAQGSVTFDVQISP